MTVYPLTVYKQSSQRHETGTARLLRRPLRVVRFSWFLPREEDLEKVQKILSISLLLLWAHCGRISLLEQIFFIPGRGRRKAVYPQRKLSKFLYDNSITLQCALRVHLQSNICGNQPGTRLIRHVSPTGCDRQQRKAPGRTYTPAISVTATPIKARRVSTRSSFSSNDSASLV